MTEPRSLSICLINPRFAPSYWGREYALPLFPGDKRAWTMGGALPLLAALTPQHHSVRLIDESVEAIDFDALAQFDIVGITGMIVQRARMKEILLKLGRLPVHVVVGGPYASIEESFFEGLCDTLFVGEADTSWPVFIADFAAGMPTAPRYEQADPTDMTALPAPRIDLMKSRHYMSGSLQFSRGCPFRCEFCDIIVIFGRRPRVKTPEQVVAELEDMRQTGITVCFIVDDNFIGNKKAVKILLPAIIAWQEAHAYPMRLSTEATLNLAEDPELMQLMYRANFRDVFIGIESPREASLLETKKTQNVRTESMSVRLDRIRDAGLLVMGGFILGFDNDDPEIFEEQFTFIQDNAIGRAALGILMALPKTPLYQRLKDEGRLMEDGHVCNFEPRQMSRDALVDGAADLLRRLYTTDAFFDRIFNNIARSASFQIHRADMVAKSSRRGTGPGSRVRMWSDGLVMIWRLGLATVKDGVIGTVGRDYVRHYRAQGGLSRAQRISLPAFVGLCVLHWHHYKLIHAPSEEAGQRAVSIYDAQPMPMEVEHASPVGARGK